MAWICSRGKGARTGHSMNYGNDEQGCRVGKGAVAYFFICRIDRQDIQHAYTAA